jgi:hypothetical protein
MAGVRPLDQLGTSPYRTLTEPCFAASLPARVTCGGIRARHDSLLGLPDQPVAATTPPVAAESSTTETCVLRPFTGRDSTGERSSADILPRGLEEESGAYDLPARTRKRSRSRVRNHSLNWVELRGFEPLTFCMPSRLGKSVTVGRSRTVGLSSGKMIPAGRGESGTV